MSDTFMSQFQDKYGRIFFSARAQKSLGNLNLSLRAIENYILRCADRKAFESLKTVRCGLTLVDKQRIYQLIPAQIL